MANKRRSVRWNVDKRAVRIPRTSHTTVPLSLVRSEQVTAALPVETVTAA